MATYLTFYVEKPTEITKCCLVLEGLEAVHGKQHADAEDKLNRNIINIVRISTTNVHIHEEQYANTSKYGFYYINTL